MTSGSRQYAEYRRKFLTSSSQTSRDIRKCNRIDHSFIRNSIILCARAFTTHFGYFLYSLCDWTEETCVQPNKKWKIVAEEASCQISKRIQKVVDHWETSNKVLKKIDEEIIDVFAKEFGLMEHQVNELEGISK